MLKANRSTSKRLLGLSILGALIALMLACTPSHPQSTFDTLGPVSRNQAFIFIVIFWIGLAVFIAVEGAIIYMVFRFRRRSPDEGDPVQVHGNNKLELAWTIAPVFILLIAAVPTINGVFFAATAPVTPAQGGLEVDVIGHQWWFEFRYQNPNNPGEQIAVANELYIPVGEPVTFRLDSVDVIHSFWVPKLAGKVDMIPNNDNTMWFQADVTGEFFGQCAEFCGVSHANMRFKVIAVDRPEFDAWLQRQAVEASDAIDPLAAQGQALFRSAGCSGCHADKSIIRLRDDGSRRPGRTGPNMTHVASRLNVAGMLRNAEEGSNVVNNAILQANLKTWITDPDEIKPGNIMFRQAAVYTDPEKALSEQDVDALVAYLLTLK